MKQRSRFLSFLPFMRRKHKMGRKPGESTKIQSSNLRDLPVESEPIGHGFRTPRFPAPNQGAVDTPRLRPQNMVGSPRPPPLDISSLCFVTSDNEVKRQPYNSRDPSSAQTAILSSSTRSPPSTRRRPGSAQWSPWLEGSQFASRDASENAIGGLFASMHDDECESIREVHRRERELKRIKMQRRRWGIVFTS